MAGCYTIYPPRPSSGNDDKTIESLREKQLKMRRKSSCVEAILGRSKRPIWKTIKN
jgi:hypothetical protein